MEKYLNEDKFSKIISIEYFLPAARFFFAAGGAAQTGQFAGSSKILASYLFKQNNQIP